jgi:TonB family protein
MRTFDQRALIFSILLHAFLIAWFTITGPIFSQISWDEPSKSLLTRTLTEQEFTRLQKSRQSQQIVQQDDLKSDPNLVAPLSDKVYQSKSTNIVDQNTRAARVGAFKNVLEEGTQSPPTRKPATVEEKNVELVQNLFTLPPDALAPRDGKNRKVAAIPAPEKIGEGFSATNDYLPDISVGANTILNTQEFKYYSFYERIRQKLAFQWESRLKNSFDSLVAQGVKQLTGDRITKLRITIKKDGSILESDVMGTSGYQELDKAALDAFKAAAPFPNPPLGLLEGKEELSIDWSFVVMTAEDSGVKLTVRRNPAYSNDD